MIYVTGDIHGEIDISKLNTQNFSQAKAGDYLIVCGDFGLIWDMKPSRAEEYWMKWLSEKPWITLFVDGNHENFDRLKNYPITEEWGGKVQKIYDKVYHLMRGEIYLIEGKKIFTFGGAFSHDKMYRREGISWWEDELPTKEECEYAIANLKTVGDTVDVIITHDAPKSIARRYGYDRVDMSQVYATDKEDITAFLEHISHFVNYKQWYCGHYHMDFDDSESFHFLYQTILKIDMYKLCLVGRDDYRIHNRKSVATLLSMMPDNCYKIVVDHQPRELEKSAELKVDLHISGHTHAGQLFPLYYIFECFHLNELNYGKETIAQMEAINTSGAGGWGFAIRSDHHSEYVILKLQSTSASNR